MTLLLLCLGLGAFAWHRVRQIAAVQDALDRDWEITFNVDARPRLLPARLDRAVEERIIRNIGPERDPLFLGEKPNRYIVWQERFRGVFRGTIENLEIYYPGPLRGDLGAALARFSGLKRLVIVRPNFTKSDWAYVFAGLQRLHHLEELEIGDYELLDSTLEPLAGQQSLRKVMITTGKLGTECVATFAQLPRLRELWIEPSAFDDGHENGDPPLPENQALVRKALPNAHVIFAVDAVPTMPH